MKKSGPLSGELVEELTQFDRGSRSLTLRATSGVPGFMKLAQNAWVIGESGEGTSTATSVMTIKLAWYAWPLAPMIKMQFANVIRGFLSKLEAEAQRGSAKSAVS